MKLCKDLGLDLTSLKRNEEGLFLLPLKSGVVVGVRLLEPGLFLHAFLAPCPKEKREELFMLVMKANFLGQGTFGSAIGLSADEKLLTLSFTFPYEINERTFRGTIEDFANVADYWRTIILEKVT